MVRVLTDNAHVSAEKMKGSVCHHTDAINTICAPPALLCNTDPGRGCIRCQPCAKNVKPCKHFNALAVPHKNGEEGANSKPMFWPV